MTIQKWLASLALAAGLISTAASAETIRLAVTDVEGDWLGEGEYEALTVVLGERVCEGEGVPEAQRLPMSDAVDEAVWLMHAEALGVSAPCDCDTDCVEV